MLPNISSLYSLFTPTSINTFTVLSFKSIHPIVVTLEPPFPGLSQCPGRGYVRQAPDEPFKNQADRLPKATDITDIRNIQILDDKRKFVNWMYYVQATLDYYGMGQLINPNLDRPRPHGKLGSKKYENWRVLALRVSG